jgi:hypothetical protein
MVISFNLAFRFRDFGLTHLPIRTAGRNIPSDLLKEQEELRERMPYDDPAKFERAHPPPSA